MSLGTSLDHDDVDHWFVTEVLPLEPAFMRFLRRNWPDKAEVADLRQEAYLRIYAAAKRQRPHPVKPYLYLVGRNLMIDRLRQKSVVAIESIADIEGLNVSGEEPTPEQHVAARQELRRMQSALDDLPARCRQVIMLRRIHGLSQREIAEKMGIKEETVESHIAKGMRLLSEATVDRRGSLAARARRYLTGRNKSRD